MARATTNMLMVMSFTGIGETITKYLDTTNFMREVLSRAGLKIMR